MSKEIDALCTALTALSQAVRTQSVDERPIGELIGAWTVPTVSPVQLADLAANMAQELKTEKLEDISPVDSKLILSLSKSISDLTPQIVPNLLNGNAPVTVPAYLATLSYVSSALAPILGWKVIRNRNALPQSVAARLAATQERIDNLIGDASDFEVKVTKINDAFETAEELPETLDSLRKANAAIRVASDEANQHFGRIKDLDKLAKERISSIEDAHDEATRLAENCGEAYRITTSIGLAASFDERAKSLNISIRLWVAGLAMALIAVAIIGYTRRDILDDLFKSPSPLWSVIMAKSFISFLAISPAIWFAWLATKQIGQRFRMAEDYAFKASVAKAYEGYRREAARLDPAFEAQLFESALVRVDEAPLRLIESHSHGSPLQDLLQTAEFRSALETVPGLKSIVASLGKKRKENSAQKDASNMGDAPAPNPPP